MLRNSVDIKGFNSNKKTTKLQNNNNNNNDNNITNSGSKPIMLLIPFIQPLQKAKKKTVYVFRMRQYRRLVAVNTLDVISTGKLNAGDRNK
jgi:hypothetical protein